MAKTAVATPTVELEAIDRLEQKLKQLLAVLDKTRTEYTKATEELTRARTEQTRAAEENTRLRAELDTARTRLVESEGTVAELGALRTEREQIRSRVDDMLKQIDALNL
jgi:chromosome segregation ATPase